MQTDTAAAPSLIRIGKTIYQATPTPPAHETIKRTWTLVATRGSKQEKTLIESAHGFTLWSAPNGMRGRVGLPKTVEPAFMGQLELVTA